MTRPNLFNKFVIHSQNSEKGYDDDAKTESFGRWSVSSNCCPFEFNRSPLI